MDSSSPHRPVLGDKGQNQEKKKKEGWYAKDLSIIQGHCFLGLGPVNE
jgi:hypothetical protein